MLISEVRKPRTQHVRHIRLVGEVNNNLIERLQGTRRERDKVLRGMEGLDIYYNFIRPHMSLNGKTPAEEARALWQQFRRPYNLSWLRSPEPPLSLL